MRQLTNCDKVREFHVVMGTAVDQPPSSISGALLHFRNKLISEETKEAEDALYDLGFELVTNREEAVLLKAKAAYLKELCDILYVVYGTAVSFGWDIDTAFNRVHASNMSKLGEDGKPIYREDGKVMKGPNYTPPDLEGLV